MPFDSNGIFSLAPGYLGTTGQTILTSQHNPPLEDIAAGLSVTFLRTGVAPMLANLPMGGYKITGLAAGVAATDAVNKGQIDSAAPPVGAVIDFAGATAPSGWLLCYGQAISRSSYAALFTAIGTTYGVGDGTTTFNIPDCRGRVAAGKDDMGGTPANRLTGYPFGVDGDVLGGVGGEDKHVLITAELAAHGHTFTGSPLPPHAHTYQVDAGTGGSEAPQSGFRAAAAVNTSSVSAGTPTGTISNSGSGAAHNNVQPTIIFTKIIRSGI